METSFFAIFSRELELPPFGTPPIDEIEKVRRQPLPAVRLPRREKLLAIMAPERRLLVFRASAEKGLLVAFPTATKRIEYRDDFLSVFADFCEAYRAGLEARGIAPAPDPACRPLDWWTLLDTVNEREERASGAGVTIGKLGFDRPEPTGDAGE